jgi:hypothetical protein
MMQENIDKTIRGLKDFQLKTVDYIFDQLYNKDVHKMLIADEVGLGKTIVAKGIIAKAFERYLANGGQTKDNPTFNVVYICSNLALAAQNIRKLNFTGDNNNVAVNIDRLIYLAYKSPKKPPLFLINSLTPGTSFNEKSHQGAANERAIIFCLLTEFKVFEKRWIDLEWMLKGGVSTDRWKGTVSSFHENRHNYIRRDLFSKYKDALRIEIISPERYPKIYAYLNKPNELSLWHGLIKICDSITGNHKVSFNLQNEIIRNLRRILSRLCLEYLNADIFILDEFQRFNNLIKLDEEAESPAMELARSVFDIKGAKVLLLSATPFKPYTNDFDEQNGEIHYKEFEAVLKFLMTDKDETFWQTFRAERKTFFSHLRHPEKMNESFDDTLKLKHSLEQKYRNCMVRTERLMASSDRDALVSSMLHGKTLTLTTSDIDDFVNLDRITYLLNERHQSRLPIPVEYVKSSPYALSFLENYQHRKKLAQFLNEDNDLKTLLTKTRHAWINHEDIDNYKPLLQPKGQKLPNAKLRLLLDTTLENGGWKYLWIPPTINYYPTSGAFKNSGGFSKTLIFSSWLLVPRMVSALVSYETERHCLGNPASITEREKLEEKRNYFTKKGKKRSPVPQFTFKLEKKDDLQPKQMSTFSFLYPSVSLATLYDPTINLKEKKSLAEIKRYLKIQLSNILLSDEINLKYATGNGEWQKWYWAAPIIMDNVSDNSKIVSAWLSKGFPYYDFSNDADDDSQKKEENSGRTGHFNFASQVFHNPEQLDLPVLTPNQLDQVSEFLAMLCLGSPSICYLRSQLHHFSLDQVLLDSSFIVASGFITLFNKPESIATVRLTTDSVQYLDKVLEYSVDGNMQSFLDEYLYMIMNSENFSKPIEIANHIADILSVRTSSIEVDDLKSFTAKVNHTSTKGQKHSIRTHYAMDFNSQKLVTSRSSSIGNEGKDSTQQNLGRQVGVRQAFNSPFRPFVLATTSIGQEGLDFHLYCRKIFHWNLPSNPIDFEQREGRIHRYKGLVIRQNIAAKYIDHIALNGHSSDLWETLFSIASLEEKSKTISNCDLVPFWHTESLDNIKIERYVPLYPFSKDIERYRQMLKVLTYYRLTFGQPRQEELIDALFGGMLSEEQNKMLDQLIINLSPMRFVENHLTHL